jgi:hypothetical protein
LRDPAGEIEELGREECGVVEEPLDFFQFDWFRISGGCGLVVVQSDDDAEEPLAGEGDEDACADFWGEVAEGVGEGAVERDRQGDVGVEGHEVKGIVRVCAFAEPLDWGWSEGQQIPFGNDRKKDNCKNTRALPRALPHPFTMRP